jgi:hypothetical protein
MIRNLLAAAAIAVASVAAAVVGLAASPALAAVHKPFVVIVNGGADVTLEHLTVGQEVYHAGIAYEVVNVRGHAVVFAPRFTAPSGTVAQFST